MFPRHALLLAALSTLSTPAIASQPATQLASADDERLALANRIIDISYPQDRREKMFEGVAKQVEQQMVRSLQSSLGNPELVSVITDFQKDVSAAQRPVLRKHVPLLMEAWASAYAEIFSADELREILAFVSTKTGSSFMMKTTDVMTNPRYIAASQAFYDETTKVMMDRIPELDKAIKARMSKSATK